MFGLCQTAAPTFPSLNHHRVSLKTLLSVSDALSLVLGIFSIVKTRVCVYSRLKGVYNFLLNLSAVTPTWLALRRLNDYLLDIQKLNVPVSWALHMLGSRNPILGIIGHSCHTTRHRVSGGKTTR